MKRKEKSLDAYRVITKDNFEAIKEIFLEASIAQWNAEQVAEKFIAIGLNKSQAWGLIDVEYDGTGFGQMSLSK